MRIRFSWESITAGVHTVAVLLWLVLYVSGTSQLEFIHSAIHEEHALSHTEEQERDSCHRAIHHNDRTLGCRHEAHLTATAKCAMCDLTCCAHPAIVADVAFHFVKEPVLKETPTLVSTCGERFVFSSSRAPPIGFAS